MATLDKEGTLALVDELHRVLGSCSIIGNESGSARMARFYKTGRADNGAHPTVEEAVSILRDIIEGAGNSDPTTYLIYLDREDERFKTLVIASYHIFEHAYNVDWSGKNPCTVCTDCGARRTDDLIVIDAGELVGRGIFIMDKKTAPSFPFDIINRDALRGAMPRVRPESLQSVMVHDSHVLQRVLYSPSRIPVALYTVYTSFSGSSHVFQTVLPIANKDGVVAICRMNPMRISFDGGEIQPCVFTIDELKNFIRAKSNITLRLRWPVLIPSDLDMSWNIYRVSHSGINKIVSDIWFTKAPGSGDTKKRDCEEFAKSTYKDGLFTVVLKTPSLGVSIAAFPHKVTGLTDIVLVRPIEGAPRFLGARYERNRGERVVCLSTDEFSATVLRMGSGATKTRLWSKVNQRNLEKVGLKALVSSACSAVVNLGDGCIILTHAAPSETRKRTISFSIGEDGDGAILLAGSKAYETLKEMNDEATLRNISLVRTLSLEETLQAYHNTLQSLSASIELDALNKIKKSLGLTQSENLSRLVDTRRADIFGGITHDFILEMLSTMGPPGWGVSVVEGHVIWYKHTLRYTNRNSGSGDSPANKQNKEKPFVRYETTLRGLIMLSKTSQGWLITTRLWHTGKHPNVGSNGGLCHGAVTGSVLDEGDTKAMMAKNGKFTIKEAFRAINKAAELCAASVETGDSGTGFDNFTLEEIDGRRPIVPIFKYNAFANVSSMGEKDAKEAIAAWGREEPWMLVPPYIAHNISDCFQSAWWEGAPVKTANLFDIIPESTFRDGNVNRIRLYSSPPDRGASEVELAVNESYLVTVTLSQYQALVANNLLARS